MEVNSGRCGILIMSFIESLKLVKQLRDMVIALIVQIISLLQTGQKIGVRKRHLILYFKYSEVYLLSIGSAKH